MRRKSYSTVSPGRRASTLAARPITPFPKKQMFILALCRLCEPIAFMGIFPYIYFMIQDFHITEDEKKISFYAGLVTSSFTFAEFSAGVFWGRLSDRIGRKPVLLTGLAGTALSVLIFGFAPNLTVALIARALGGLLNGNMGVLQTTVAELTTEKAHEARAYTIMPVVWNLGSIIGPVIGGALARPCMFYPDLFPPGTIWDRFPYLLPNLFSAVAVLCGFLIGVFFLEETHTDKKKQRDRGVELGKRFLAKFQWRPSCVWSSSASSKKGGEEEPLLESDEQLPGYRTSENSPTLASASGPVLEESLDLTATGGPKRSAMDTTGLRSNKIFTRQVVLNIVSFGILAFHTMTYDQLLPVFLSTRPPAHEAAPSLPFKFVGGFGFDNQTIGVIISVQGFYSLLTSSFLFPWASRRVGELRLFQYLAVTYFLLYLITPYLVLLPEHLRMVGIYLMIIWKCTFSTMAYPSNSILMKNSATSMLWLGTIMGVSASTASLCRAFGPTLSGVLYATGLETGYSGLAWWCSSAVCLVGAAVALQLKDMRPRLDEKDDVEAVLALPPPAVGDER